MNDFLEVSRNEFLFSKDEFISFRRDIQEITKPINKRLRIIWEEKNRVVKDIIDPFVKISKTGGIFKNTEKRLYQMIGDDLNEGEFNQKAFSILKECRNEDIEDENASIDRILKKSLKKIPLGEDKNVLIQIDSTIKETHEVSEITWDPEKEKVIVSISPKLFYPKKVLFLGKKFEVIYVAKKDKDPGISVNVDDQKVYINPFNNELCLYSVTSIDIMISLEVADVISNTKIELKDNFLRLVGIKQINVDKYMRPLGDDLRRTMALSK